VQINGSSYEESFSFAPDRLRDSHLLRTELPQGFRLARVNGSQGTQISAVRRFVSGIDALSLQYFLGRTAVGLDKPSERGAHQLSGRKRTAQRAKHFYDRVIRELVDECDFSVELWNLQVLAVPRVGLC
jgi:hypothetical protein